MMYERAKEFLGIKKSPSEEIAQLKATLNERENWNKRLYEIIQSRTEDIEKREAELGAKPKFKPETTCIFTYNGNSSISILICISILM